MPPPSTAVPDGLSWDLWLGPAEKRDFNAEYLPAKWRSFWDFGLGMLGDFGCHTFDTPVWALDLDSPTVVECLQREKSLDGVIPTGSHIRFHFPGKGTRGPVTLDWFDGPQDWSKVGRIEKFGAEHAAHLGRACWLVGSKGMLGCGTHAGVPILLPEAISNDWKANPPTPSIPRVAGGPFREWLRAIKGEGPEPGSNFDNATKLNEIILLGVLAQRFNSRIEWDTKTARITNHPELNAYVKEPVREGWSYGEDLWKQG
jgi:predicted dehydrogenase